MFKTINIDHWERKDLFLYFQSFDDPTWNISADVRINHFYEVVKELNASFFLSFLYIASKVSNDIAAFRQRIDTEGNVQEYQIVHPGSTILYDNGTFGFGYFHYHRDFKTFLRDATVDFEEQKSEKGLNPRDEDLARIYFSPIPWISFTSFSHPFRLNANHSIPKIVFGKHEERNRERLMPVGLTLHHGLADGYHAGLFFAKLQEAMDDAFNSLQLSRTV